MTTLLRTSLGIHASRIALALESRRRLSQTGVAGIALPCAGPRPSGIGVGPSGSWGVTCHAPAGLEHRGAERGRSLEGTPQDRRSGGACCGCEQNRLPAHGSRSFERDPGGGGFATHRSPTGRHRAGALPLAALLQAHRRHGRGDPGQPAQARSLSLHDNSSGLREGAAKVPGSRLAMQRS